VDAAPGKAREYLVTAAIETRAAALTVPGPLNMALRTNIIVLPPFQNYQTRRMLVFDSCYRYFSMNVFDDSFNAQCDGVQKI
jgi:hypothetical protein